MRHLLMTIISASSTVEHWTLYHARHSVQRHAVTATVVKLERLIYNSSLDRILYIIFLVEVFAIFLECNGAKDVEIDKPVSWTLGCTIVGVFAPTKKRVETNSRVWTGGINSLHSPSIPKAQPIRPCEVTGINCL